MRVVHNNAVHNRVVHNNAVHNRVVRNNSVHNRVVHNNAMDNRIMYNNPVQNGVVHNNAAHHKRCAQPNDRIFESLIILHNINMHSQGITLSSVYLIIILSVHNNDVHNKFVHY